jgi:hypothetical protein
MQRRSFKHMLSFPDRLEQEGRSLKHRAHKIRRGKEREMLLRKASQSKRMSKSTNGFHPQTCKRRSNLGKYPAYVLASRKKLGCLRRRLATEADSAMTTTLTRLWEKETERCAIAIQKEIDKGNAQPREERPSQLATSPKPDKNCSLLSFFLEPSL